MMVLNMCVMLVERNGLYNMSDEMFNSLLTHTCKISRRTYNSSSIDKWGASTETFTTISESESCLFQETEELVEYSRRGEKFYTRILVFFKISADVEQDDIIERNSKKFRVGGIEDAAGQNHHKEGYLINLEN